MSRKILVADIETSPHLCYTFQTKNAFITPVQVIDPTRMLGFSAKWHHEKRVRWYSEFDGEQITETAHRSMVEEAFTLLDEADVVATYNGDNFDLPHLRREFREYGLGQPSPFHSVDLYKVIRANERWMSHKLAYITARYRLSGKMSNDGWPLWIGCLNGDPKMWRQMERYGKQDTRTTDELLDACSDLVQMPALALFDDEPLDEGSCPICRLPGQSRGFAYTKTRRYPRYYCAADKKWFRGNRSDRSAGIA